MTAMATIEGLQVGPAGRPILDVPGPVELLRAHTAILGPSGAGKTTLIELLAHFPAGARERWRMAGSHRWHPLDDGQGGPARHQLAWAPTDAGHWPGIPAWQQVAASVPGAGRKATREEREYAELLLGEFGLDHVREAAPETMSAGERTRLLTVRALATQAHALLLDEPFAHVSMAARSRYRSVLKHRAKAQGSVLVFSTHDPEAVVHMAEQVLCLDRGRLVFHGAVAELQQRPPSRAAALQLGPINWHEPAEWERWLGEAPRPGTRGVRPEALGIAPAPDGQAAVVESRFLGAMEELDLRRDDGVEETFWHRPPRPTGPPGARVAIRLLVTLLCALLGACGGGAEGAPFEPDVIRSLPPHQGGVPAPRGLAALRDGGLLALDTVGRVVRYGPDGRVAATWSMPDTSVGRPEGLCELPDGAIAVADTHYHRVVTFGPMGTVRAMFGEQGDGPGQFRYPVTICTDGRGHLYVGEYGGNDRVQKFTLTGGHVATFGPQGEQGGGPTVGAGRGQLQRPAGIAWRAGLIYVADAVNHRIAIFRDTGEPLDPITPPPGADPLRFPYDLCFDGQGRLLTVEHDAGRVTAFAPENGRWRIAWRIGNPGRDPGQLATPWGIAVDRPREPNARGTDRAPDGRPRLWIADTGNSRLVGVPLP